MEMKKMELKNYRDSLITNQYKQGLLVEDIAYIYNISSRRVCEILKVSGIEAKVDSKVAKEMKSTKVVSKKKV